MRDNINKKKENVEKGGRYGGRKRLAAHFVVGAGVWVDIISV